MNFIGVFRRLTTRRLKVTGSCEIGNKAIVAGTGTTYYVDSTNTSAADTNDGRSWASPLATIDAAIGKCTANQGDMIIVAEGHTESYTTTGTKLTGDVAGIDIVGLGSGANVPTISFGHTGATWVISAASVRMKNIKLYTTVDQVTTFLTVSGDDCDIDVITMDQTNKEVVTDVTVTGKRNKITVRKYGYVDGDANARVVSLNAAHDSEINIYAATKVTTAIVNMVTAASKNVIINGVFYVNGTTDLSKNVVDTITGSTWCCSGFDLGAGSNFSGGSGAALAVDDISAIAATLTATSGVIGTIADVAGTNTVVALLKAIKAKTDTIA